MTRLVPLRADHAALLWRWAQDRDLHEMTGAWPQPPSRERIDELVAGWLVDPTIRAFIIEVDGVPVGNCWLGHIDGRSATLGIAIAEPVARDRGAGTEAVRLLLAEAHDLERVTLWAYADNARALAVYRKVGFTESGRGERDGREVVEMARSRSGTR